jgi:hypothetical protein
MKMAYRNQREVAKLRSALAKAKEGSPANVDKYPRLSIDPKEITGRRAIGVDPGSTRTQDLDCYRTGGAALSQRGGRDEKKREQANDDELNHECISVYLSRSQKS